MARRTAVVLTSVLVITVMLMSACAPQAASTAAPAPTQPPIIQTVIVEKEGTPQVVVVTATPAPTTPPQPTPPPPAAPAGPKVLRFSGGAQDIPSIDPSHAQSTDEIQVIESTSLGLVRQNETTAELELSLATDYKVSDDGLTYTFHVMPNIPWVKWDANQGKVVKVQDCNGKDRTVTANDFAFGILRTLNPATASEYSYVLTPYLVGANDYNSTPVTDTAKLDENRAKVGVKVIDPLTIQYTFVAPAVYNLNILGLWVARAQPQWLIEGDDCTDARGERWTEQGLYQGYGPFTLKEWFHDANMSLIKNPYWPGNATVPVAKIDEIQMKFEDSGASFAEFEAGQMDSSGIPTGDLDRVLTDPKYKDSLRYGITLGTEMYGFQTKLAPTDDVRVRLALALSVDRDALVKSVAKGETPAQFYTNRGAARAPKPDKYPNLGNKFDPAKAKDLLNQYLTEKKLTADQLKLTLMYNTSDSNKKVAEAVQAMWKDNLGITVDLVNQERKVYYATRADGKNNIYRLSWVQDYPDANNFLYEVFGPGGGFQNIVKWDSGDLYTKFVDLLKQGAVEKDPAKRMDIYAQAEKALLTDEAAVVPLWWYTSPYVMRPYVLFTKSITGYDHYEKWDILPH